LHRRGESGLRRGIADYVGHAGDGLTRTVHTRAGTPSLNRTAR
jgi:hypothetical protein